MTDTAERDYTDKAPIAELARTGELRWKDGRDIVVTVKDAGSGPMIDVREYVTRDAYSAQDFADAGKTVRAGNGRNRKGDRFVTLKEPYVGPTRVGFWVSLETAEALTDAIAAALMAAGSLETEGTER